jgi:hypothetical protein
LAPFPFIDYLLPMSHLIKNPEDVSSIAAWFGPTLAPNSAFFKCGKGCRVQYVTLHIHTSIERT